MELKFKFPFFIFLLFAIFFGITGNVLADLSNVQYPISELNNCNSQNECKNFCEQVENIGRCLGYAEENNLMNKMDIEEARKVLPSLEDGKTPGSCKTKGACELYCDEDQNFDECLGFAYFIKRISPEIYEIAKITKGIGPGGCRRDKCEDFCSLSENFNECLNFAAEYGLIGGEDYELSRKLIPLIEAGKMPGGCNSESSCNEYCGDQNNFEECANVGLGMRKNSTDEISLVGEVIFTKPEINLADKGGDNENSRSTTSKNEDSESGSYEHDSPPPSSSSSSREFEEGISLVGVTKPEINFGEESDSPEEIEVEGSNVPDRDDFNGQGDSEEDNPEEDGKSDLKDSGNSPWTINSRVVAPFQKPAMPEGLFDFFKRVLRGFY